MPQIEGKYAQNAVKEVRNLNKDRVRGYIDTGSVKILTHCFSVPKEGDIRMVYNWTSSGFNDSPWYPHFALPMVRTTMRAIEEGNYRVVPAPDGIFIYILTC